VGGLGFLREVENLCEREGEGERERRLVEGEGLGLSKRGVWGVGERRKIFVNVKVNVNGSVNVKVEV